MDASLSIRTLDEHYGIMIETSNMHGPYLSHIHHNKKNMATYLMLILRKALSTIPKFGLSNNQRHVFIFSTPRHYHYDNIEFW